MELKELINEVVEARAKAKEANCQRVAEYNKWLEANQVLFDNEKSAKCDQDLAEIKLREAAVEAYRKTLDKAIAPGVGIREIIKLDYDADLAFKWAKEHGIALKLDTPTFEKIAKTAPETRPGFVTLRTEIQATIATDLSKVLEVK